MKKRTKKISRPRRSLDTPATAGMLYEMEERLNHRMDSGFHSLKADINSIKADVNDIRATQKADMHIIKTDINSIKATQKADMHSIKADIHAIRAEFHRVALLVEEQNARNKYVLDGYAQIYAVLERNDLV